MIRKKIGDILIEKGVIDSKQLSEALKSQKRSGRKVGQILVESGLITDEQLAEAISEHLRVARVSLDSLMIDPAVIAMVPVEKARRYCLIPIFKFQNNLTIAMADPLNIIAIEELKYLTKCEIKRAIATRKQIEDAIDRSYSVAHSISNVIGTYPAEQTDPGPSEAASEILLKGDDAPVVRLVNLIITQAVKAGASDIHIEPDESRMRIRYRLNGVMKEEASPPKNLQAEIVSRIKVAANMDLSEKRLPQDGRITMKIDDNDVDLRISTLPTIHGEKIVIRILDRRILDIGLERLGFSKNLLESWKKLISLKEGLLLITGPTSSGKTTTLYSVLQEINSIEKNIITVEDPAEYSLPLINQVQVNEKAGLTFASSLRSILRQNPDVIMIGEIRDIDTAMMAVRSALTGHLVLSTLHTNDAPSSVTRLVNMGIEKYLVASSLKGVLAQRLLRTNCDECGQEYTPPPVELRMANLDELSGEIKFKHGVGCTKCRMTGFKGQTGIYELIAVDEKISEMIVNDAPEAQIRNYARGKGYRTLFQAGIDKVSAGDVCLEELLRVISIVEETPRSVEPERIPIGA